MRQLVAIAVVSFAVLLGTAQAYRSYQTRIPNGDKVAHPCPSNGSWPGVGHWNRDGGGERNNFGVQFFQNGLLWNRTLCMMDSDLDGRKNGEELGDPDCVWVPGATPSRTTGITHPGICEPLNSLLCKIQNGDRVTCGSGTFKSTLGLLCGLLLTALLLR